jgi:hypothetical protein
MVRIFYGRLWLKKGCFADDDDDLYICHMLLQSEVRYPVAKVLRNGKDVSVLN